jgi:hypothetical protein
LPKCPKCGEDVKKNPTKNGITDPRAIPKGLNANISNAHMVTGSRSGTKPRNKVQPHTIFACLVRIMK